MTQEQPRDDHLNRGDSIRMKSLLSRALTLVICQIILAGSILAVDFEDDAGLVISTSVPELNTAYTADKMIDNDVSTEWVAADDAVAAGGPATIVFEWPNPVSIKRVQIHHNFYPPDDYRIETWNGSSWVEHIQVTSPPANSDDVLQEGRIAVPFPAQTTRLRINIVFSNLSNYPRIAEVTVSDTLLDLPNNLEDRYGLTIVADGGNAFGGVEENVIDNNTTTEWISGTHFGGVTGAPDIITITWPNPVHIEYVLINMGYYNLKTYNVETWNGSGWVVHDEIVDQPHSPYAVLVHQNGEMSGADFPNETTRLRLNVLAGNDSNYTRFAEITILEEPPASPSRYEDFDLTTEDTFNFFRLNQTLPFRDLDLDGRIDLVAPVASGVRVFQQQASDPLFTTEDSTLLESSEGATHRTTGFFIEDLNGDFLRDVGLLRGYPTSSGDLPNVGVDVRINAAGLPAAPSFTYASTHNVNYSYYMGVGDVSGDGRPDIAFREHSSTGGRVRVAIQQSSGLFTLSGPQYLVGETNPYDGAILIHDVNEDGRADVMRVDNTANRALLFLSEAAWPQDGTELTTPTATYVNTTPGAATTDLGVGDVDGDGQLDLVVAGGTGFSIWTNQATLWNKQPSAVAPDQAVNAGEAVTAVEVIDLDVDGQADVLVSTSNGKILLFLAQETAPVFTSLPDAIYGVNAFASVGDIIVQDINKDGQYDLVAYENQIGSMVVLMSLAESGVAPQLPERPTAVTTPFTIYP